MVGEVTEFLWEPNWRKVETLLVLRQAQDEEEWNSADLSLSLMLSLSKHEEASSHPCSPRRRGPRPVHAAWKRPPTPNPLPLKGGKGFVYPRHCERSEATQGADTDRN